MEENLKLEYHVPETDVFEVQAAGFMVPSSWGHEEG